jgi:tRNA A-37 threonylcarbamoyl transferase component Bud32
MHDRGLPTPRPLLILHRRRWGCDAEGYLLTQSIPDAVTLADWVRSKPSRERLLTIAERLGRVIRIMHERGVTHRDLKASNILLDPKDRPWIIDLVGVSTQIPIDPSSRTRDLGRLAASFVDLPIVTNSIRLRFLQSYHDREWKEWWVSIAKRVDEKVERNRRRGRVLG